MTDGYSSTIIDLILEQTRIIQRMAAIDREVENLPQLPPDMGSWIESIPDITNPSNERFKVSDLKKLTKLNKEYNKLKERDEEMRAKIKLYMIDSVLDSLEGLSKDKDV